MTKVLNRIGSVHERYDLDLTIHYLELEVSEEVSLEFSWRKKGRSSITHKDLKASPESRRVQVEEHMNIDATMYRKNNGKYVTKKINIDINADSKKGKMHKIGTFTLLLKDMSELPYRQETLDLKTSIDKHAQICFSVTANPIEVNTEHHEEAKTDSSELQVQLKINQDLKREVDELRNNLETRNDEYNQVKLRLEALENESNNLDHFMEQKISKIIAKNKEKKSVMKEHFAAREEDIRATTLRALQDIKLMQNSHKEDSKKQEKNVEKIEELEKSLAHAQLANTQLNGQIADLESHLQIAKEENQMLMEKFKLLEGTPNPLDSELDKLEQRMSNVMRRLSTGPSPPSKSQDK